MMNRASAALNLGGEDLCRSVAGGVGVADRISGPVPEVLQAAGDVQGEDLVVNKADHPE